MALDGHRADDPREQLRQACTELQRRLRAGQPCCAEQLLAEFPAVSRHEDLVLDLIYTEYVLRKHLGEEPTPDPQSQRGEPGRGGPRRPAA